MAQTPRTRDTKLDNVRTASGINILLGIWLIIAPFIIGYTGVENALWNDIIVGAAILILAAVRASDPIRRPGLSWLNMVLGIWLILAPFILNYSQFAEPLWNDIIVGVLVAGLAAWSAAATRSVHPAPR